MSSADSIWASPSDIEYSRRRSQTTSSSHLLDNNKCEWLLSIDGKYLIGYISVINPDTSTNFNLGANLVQGGQYGAIVEHVTPGTLANTACKLKVGDEIVEWNGHSFKNKNNNEIAQIIESSRSCARNNSRTRIVAVRLNNNLIDLTSVAPSPTMSK